MAKGARRIADIWYKTDLLEGVEIVERDDGMTLVKGATFIKAGLSQNKNFYPAATLRKAVPLFKSKSVRTDHPTMLKGQSVRDVVGKTTEDVWFDEKEGKLKGDILFSSAEGALMTKAREGLVGDLSINGRGDTEAIKVGNSAAKRVNELTHLFSLDLVCDASAGGSLQEEFRQVELAVEKSRRSLEMLENVDLKELKQTRKDLVEAIINEYVEEHGEGKKIEKKEEVSTSPVTLKDVQEAATKAAETATANVLKELKAKDDDASHLSDVIESVEASLKECNVDDKVRAVLRESMIPFALKEFGKVGNEIDAKKLAERRDELLDTLRGIASLLKESKDEKKGSEEKKGADKTETLVGRSL
jgi:hypothetical protein